MASVWTATTAGAALLVLTGGGAPSGGSSIAGANAAAHVATPTLVPTAVPTLPPTLAPTPVPTLPPPPPPSTLKPKPSPTPRPTPGYTRITFSGALSGTLVNLQVVCRQNIPTGGQGYMAVYGILPDGTQHGVTIWSSSRTKATEIYEGTDSGEIDYIEYGNPPKGVTNFDWSVGATIHAQLLPQEGGNAAPGSTLEVDGTIACP
jgi:hypothetical protein